MPASRLGGSARRGRRVACAAVDLRKVIERLADAEDLSEGDAMDAMDALLDADPAGPGRYCNEYCSPRQRHRMLHSTNEGSRCVG